MVDEDEFEGYGDIDEGQIQDPDETTEAALSYLARRLRIAAQHYVDSIDVPVSPISYDCRVSLNSDCILRILEFCHLGYHPFFQGPFQASRYSRELSPFGTRVMFETITLSGSKPSERIFSFIEMLKSPLCTFINECKALVWQDFRARVANVKCSSLLRTIVGRLPRLEKLEMIFSSFPAQFPAILQPLRVVDFAFTCAAELAPPAKFPLIANYIATASTLVSLTIGVDEWHVPVGQPQRVLAHPENITSLRLNGAGMGEFLKWLNAHLPERAVRPSELVLSDVNISNLEFGAEFVDRARDSIERLSIVMAMECDPVDGRVVDKIPWAQLSHLKSLHLSPFDKNLIREIMPVVSLLPPTLESLHFFACEREDMRRARWTALDEALSGENSRFPEFSDLTIHTMLKDAEVAYKLPLSWDRGIERRHP